VLTCARATKHVPSSLSVAGGAQGNKEAERLETDVCNPRLDDAKYEIVCILCSADNFLIIDDPSRPDRGEVCGERELRQTSQIDQRYRRQFLILQGGDPQLHEAFSAVRSAAQLTIDVHTLCLEQVCIVCNNSAGARVVRYDRTDNAR
jgi:hypothetical protein